MHCIGDILAELQKQIWMIQWDWQELNLGWKTQQGDDDDDGGGDDMYYVVIPTHAKADDENV